MKRYEIFKGITEGTIHVGAIFKSEQNSEKIEVREYNMGDVPAIGLCFVGTDQQVSMSYMEGEEWFEDTEARVLGQVKYAADKVALLCGRVAEETIEKEELHKELVNVATFLEDVSAREA